MISSSKPTLVGFAAAFARRGEAGFFLAGGLVDGAGLLADFVAPAAGASPIFRAIDKQSGEIVAEIELPTNQTGLPFTYEHDGKQYIALFVGGGGNAAELIAYALP